MNIFINGEQTPVPDELSMDALIDRLDLAGQRIAVEVNEELVPRSTFEAYRLREMIPWRSSMPWAAARRLELVRTQCA